MLNCISFLEAIVSNIAKTDNCPTSAVCKAFCCQLPFTRPTESE